MRTLFTIAGLLVLSLVVPGGAPHVATGLGPSLVVCGSVAPSPGTCATGFHHRGGLDGFVLHGPDRTSYPGYTGTIDSHLVWGVAPFQTHHVFCHIHLEEYDAGLCFEEGMRPPHGAAFFHRCFSETKGLHQGSLGGTGPFSCGIVHSAFP